MIAQRIFLLLILSTSACVSVAASEAGTSSEAGVAVSEATLDSYVGTYVISDGFDLKVWREGGRLMLQARGQAAWPLISESETTFRVQGMQAKVSFGTDAAGEADHVVLYLAGKETKAVRE